MRCRTFLPVLAFALCGPACSSGLSPPFTPPEQGGPPWTELTSPHFILRTDLPASEARDTTAEFERIYTTFEDVAFPFDVRPKGRVSVIVFRDQSEYREIGLRDTDGSYRRQPADSDGSQPELLVHGALTDQTRGMFQHELTHRFVRFYYPGAPQWLNEGLAEYFSTLVVEDGKAILGKPLPNLMFTTGLRWANYATRKSTYTLVPTAAIPSVADLLASDPSDFKTTAGKTEEEERESSKRKMTYYLGAWALVHLLRNGSDPFYPGCFEMFLTALSAGNGPDHAWSSAFKGITPGQIEIDFRAFLVRDTTTLLQTPYEPRTPALQSERMMTPHDVHLLWAAIRPWRTEADATRAREDIDAALRFDPTSPRARLQLAGWLVRKGRLAEGEKALRSLVAENPTDERYLIELFEFHYALAKKGSPEEKRRHLEQVEKLVPDLIQHASSSSALNSVAWYLAEHDRAAEGLPLALRSVKADFNCWECLDTLALLYSQSGDPEKALGAQTLAVNLMPDGVLVQDVFDRWERFRRVVQDLEKKNTSKNVNDAAPPPAPHESGP